MNKKSGFTLVELLIVMAILIIMATIMVGIFNAIGITNKGRDAQRKKDLNRMKIAFEEYFNDKGVFPDTSSFKCKSGDFKPYLDSWPCDPNGTAYNIFIEKNKFRIITNLENKKDKDIPVFWYERDNVIVSGLTKKEVNYGVSSSNILWYDVFVDSICDVNQCNENSSGQCKDAQAPGCVGDFCYYHTDGSCNPKCKTFCCGKGCK